MQLEISFISVRVTGMWQLSWAVRRVSWGGEEEEVQYPVMALYQFTESVI